MHGDFINGWLPEAAYDMVKACQHWYLHNLYGVIV